MIGLLRPMPKPWEETVYQVLDRIPGDAGSFTPLWRGIRQMHWHTTLAASSVCSGLLGFVADVVAAPPEITWTFVAISALSLLSLTVKAVYHLAMRWIDHRERMAMIAQGIAPPPLPPRGKLKNPPAVPQVRADPPEGE